MKNPLIVVLSSIIVLLLIIGLAILYIKLNCKAIRIVRTHSGQTTYSIVNQTGNEYEPAQCNGSLIIQGIE